MDFARAQIFGKMVDDATLFPGTAKHEQYATFVVAVNTFYHHKPGSDEKRQKTAFISCIAWGHVADFVMNNSTKGAKVFIDGVLETRVYHNKAKKYWNRQVSVVCTNFVGIDDVEDVIEGVEGDECFDDEMNL